MELIQQTIKDLVSIGCQTAITGSTHICNPPPKDTDIDYVVCTGDLITFGKTHEYLKGCGFKVDGEDNNFNDYEGMIYQFSSYRKESLNLIVTNSSQYFRRFKTATRLAKVLNLTDKRARIALFQAILYERTGDLYIVTADKDKPFWALDT